MSLNRYYAMFERAVSAVLLAGMAAVILIAAFSFLRSSWDTALSMGGALDYAVF